MKLNTIFLRFTLILVIGIVLNSCMHLNFYKVKKVKSEEESFIPAIKKNVGYMYIVHTEDKTWALQEPSFKRDTLLGFFAVLDKKTAYFTKRIYESNKIRYSEKDQYYIQQVHIHVDQFEKVGGKIQITEGDISHVDIVNKNKGLSAVAKTGVVVTSIAVPVGVFLGIACNCPHTYAFDGENYVYNNTLFTGATAPNLERDDYKMMPDFLPESSDYKISIKNEENEHQYTNQLELIVVKHDENAMVSMDQNGNIYALRALIEPVKVINDNGMDLKNVLAYNDDLGHQFNEETNSDYNNIYASFNRPKDVSNAKLIIKAKNSKWAAGVYKEFAQLFGKYYDNWVKQNHKKSKEEVEANLKKTGIPLVVSIKSGNEWIDIETIDLVGEVNYNSLVIPIEDKLLTEEKIEIRFRSGFFFWNMDYVNIDFTPKEELEIQRLSPTSAVRNNDADDKSNLASDDDLYMEHLMSGDSTNIVFSGITPSNSGFRTIYLHSKGYYLPQEKYEGKMNKDELVKFKNEGEMSRFSKYLYDSYFKTSSLKTN